MILLALAALAAPAEPPERDDPPPETGVVIAVGQRASAAVGTIARFGPSLDTTTHLSVEIPLDDRTAIRLEGGYFHPRRRVHLAGVARGYPLGRRKLTGFLEVGGHLQYAGRRYVAQQWAPNPARVWIGAPVFFGIGGRASPTDALVFDLCLSAGPLVELRQQSLLLVSLGAAVTASGQIGVRF